MSTLWVDLLGVEIHYVDAGGIRTRIVQAGSGRPIILLHGVTGSAESWARNVLALAEHGRVMAIDMVGHGFSDKPDVPYVIPAFVDHLDAVIAWTGAEQVDLAGMSLGGWVATRYALAHPEKVRTLTNVTGAGLAVKQTREDLERHHADLLKVSSGALETPTRETVRTRIEWLFHDHSKVTDELVEIRYRIFTAPDARILGRVTADVIGSDNYAYFLTGNELQTLQTPTFVLWTDHNPTTPWEEGRAAADVLPNARFSLFENCAHWPQFEAAERFNLEVGAFLAQAGG